MDFYNFPLRAKFELKASSEKLQNTCSLVMKSAMMGDCIITKISIPPAINS